MVFALVAASALSPACTSIRLNPADHRFFSKNDEKAGLVERFVPSRSITSSDQFKDWEPVLEGMTGRKPLPSEQVVFVPTPMLKKTCGKSALACYRKRHIGNIRISNKIFIDENLRWTGSQTNAAQTSQTCENDDVKGPPSLVPLLSYVHEQAHNYDYSHGETKLGKWIDEVEAVAFEFYFAEYVAKKVDLDYGLSFIANLVGNYIDARLLTGSRYYREIMQNINSDCVNCSEQTNSLLAYSSVFILYNSGFRSFKEVWEYVHENPPGIVAARIKLNAHLDNQSVLRANDLCRSLKGMLP